MEARLHPAVRDIAAIGSMFAAAGAGTVAVALTADPPGDVIALALACLIGWSVVAPFTLVRQARTILAEAADAPDAAAVSGPSWAVWSVPAQLAVLAATAVLLSIPAGAAGGILLGVGIWQLAEAAILRRWERRHGRRLLYRAAYRWAGTNGRAFGRGWFDPANFVAG
jgi:hypothetical protein